MKTCIFGRKISINITRKYTGGHISRHRQFFSFTFWSVQPKTLRVWKQMIYHWKALLNCNKKCKKNFWIFQNLLVFRAFFEKSVFWENGRGRHQMGTTLIHYTSIFIESQWGSPPESFIQKYWLVSNLPIFQNYCFFEKGPKNQKILKNSKFFFAFLVAIL